MIKSNILYILTTYIKVEERKTVNDRNNKNNYLQLALWNDQPFFQFELNLSQILVLDNFKKRCNIVSTFLSLWQTYNPNPEWTEREREQVP